MPQFHEAKRFSCYEVYVAFQNVQNVHVFPMSASKLITVCITLII